MELNINGNNTEIVFGLAFNRELDIAHKLVGNGLQFGAGLETVIPQLFSENAVILSEVIYHGTAHLKKGRPSRNQVDTYIEQCEDLDNLFDEVLKELSESNISKKKVASLKKSLKIPQAEN